MQALTNKSGSLIIQSRAGNVKEDSMKHETRYQASEKLNSMCANCARLGNACQGTDCQTWTGCVYRQEDKSQRIFEYYKHRLIRECKNPEGIRFNVIQYLCRFPEINPVEMAASLQNSGYVILFDDSSISKRDNAANRAAVNRIARRYCHE